MNLSSRALVSDNRLLAVEELLRQRKYSAAQRELNLLKEEEFQANELELGLFLCLKADYLQSATHYRPALETGLRGAKLLADSPLHRRYGRILLVLCKAYSALGDLKNADIRARDALASYRRTGDSDGQIDAHNELARIAFIRCDYPSASAFLAEALALVVDNPRKVAQLTGNLGRIRILLGQWSEAEADLSTALEYGQAHGEEQSEALNLLSLGYLAIRRREFVAAGRFLEKAYSSIQRLDLKREKVIHLEYAGELAMERGDTLKAKMLLSEAYQAGRLLAPESSLVSQASRRLAEAELALDNLEEAMKYGQKALELSLMLGEKAEIGQSRRVIARVFSVRGEHDQAVEYARDAVQSAREVGDPVELALTLLSLADLKMAAGGDEHEQIRSSLDEASRIFKRLKLDYWQAECDFRSGVFACQGGDLARGFRRLSRAERAFAILDDRTKIRAVNQFLNSLTDQAVALSISEQNEFKVFGNLMSPSEMQNLKAGDLGEVLNVLMKRTGAGRAVLFSPDIESAPVVAVPALNLTQTRRFVDAYQLLVGEEISRTRPTLLLDCRRDPHIKTLFPDLPDVVASIVVVPIPTSDQQTRFLYLDKLSVDNMLNPFSQTELNFAVAFSAIVNLKATELQKAKLLEDNRRLKTQLQENAAFPHIITRDRALLDILAQVRQVVDSPISITIEGETGSGKDLLARAIHYNSVRRNKRFVSVNCAALPETLLESELFGYKRGAFTGADRDKPGLFEEADGGTFFLDEIADMPLSIQAKVLRLLEEKELVRLGETVPVKVDVRVISATNKDLKTQMGAGLFRQDLYYRLSALSFRLPPLRERKEDVPLLTNHFLEESGKRLAPEVLRRLVAYDWPGNIRELENEIRKLVLLAGDNPEIETSILSNKIAASIPSESTMLPAAQADDNVAFDDTYSLYDYLACWEKRFIVRALKEQNGVKKHAAARLNIPESTLRLKIKQYNIDLNRLDAVN